MTRKLIYCLLAVSISSIVSPALLSAQESDCSKLQSTNAQSECYSRDLTRVEAEMNRAYERALAAYTPDQQVQKELAGMPKYDREQAIQANVRMLRKLRESQKLWLAYRDSACATVEEKYEGGTITALVVPLCRKDLAGQRKRFLQDNFGN